MEEYFLNLYIQISPSPKRLNSSLTWIVLCPGGTYKAGGEEQATPGKRSIKAKETFLKIWILLWIIIYDTDTTSRDVGTDTWNLYELHWMTTWVESSYVGEKCKIEEEKIIPNQPHLSSHPKWNIGCSKYGHCICLISNSGDARLWLGCPGTTVEGTTRGARSGGEWHLLLSFLTLFSWIYFGSNCWRPLVNYSLELETISLRKSNSHQDFPLPCKPYLLWKQTCWSSSS